jgi:hypothetical protein
MRSKLRPLIFFLCLGLLIVSCKESRIEGASYCEVHTSPIAGKYYRHSKNVNSEYIEIINDSLYKYFYYDERTKDSCMSRYDFGGRKFVNGNYQCEIVFHNFRFFYKHLQSGDSNEIKDSLYTFYCPYLVRDSVASIISDPFADSMQFDLCIE